MGVGRHVVDLPEGVLTFRPAASERFVFWPTFVGRELPTLASYQADAVRSLVAEVSAAVRRTSDQVRDARAVAAAATTTTSDRRTSATWGRDPALPTLGHVLGTDTRIWPLSAGHNRTTKKGP
jgi:hypothetical protein